MLFDFLQSNNLVIIALTGGCFCAVFSSLIDDLFEALIVKKSSINVKIIVTKCALYGLTLGLLLSVVFYAFAVQEAEPIRMIFIFAIGLGIIIPVLSKLLGFFYLKIFAPQSSNNTQ